MKESMINIMLAAGCVVLAAVAGVGIYQEDKTAPVLSCANEKKLVYTEGESEEFLLQGITAMDDCDGDVTDSVRIDEIYVTDEDHAVVVYCAKDRANNIGKLKREIGYQKAEQPEEDTAEDENLAKPELRMVQNTVTLKVGAGFNLMRYVESAMDTDGSDLTRNLHAQGEYDMSRPGSYPIQIWALNEKGVKSNIETFLLIVEE